MKKRILILFGVAIVLLLITLIFAIIVSFKVVRQTTDRINLNLKHQMQQIVRIPEVIPPETKTFYSTTYKWEMETKEREIISVKFSHSTGFDKREQNMVASLEMEANQDPSLFNKVLPAVISDKQAITSITDPKHVNLGANEQAGYEKISLWPVEGRVGQVSKVEWQFEKAKITGSSEQFYQEIYKYPIKILKILYALQQLIINLFTG